MSELMTVMTSGMAHISGGIMAAYILFGKSGGVTTVYASNKAGAIMGNDVPMIPLFQRPTYLVYKTSVKGLVDNASSQGPSFNAENWSKG